MEFNRIYIKKNPPCCWGGENEVKWGRHVGTTPPPADATWRIPPNIGGNKRSKIEGGMWVSHHLRHLGCKKEKTPMIGGVKSGRCDIYHTAPLSIENPLGG